VQQFFDITAMYKVVVPNAWDRKSKSLKLDHGVWLVALSSMLGMNSIIATSIDLSQVPEMNLSCGEWWQSK